MVVTLPTHHLSIPVRTKDEKQVADDILREFGLLEGVGELPLQSAPNSQNHLHILVEPLIEDGPYTVGPKENIETYKFTEGEYALGQVISYVEETITNHYGTHFSQGIRPPNPKQWEQAYQSLCTIQTTIRKNSGCVSIWLE